MTADPRAPAPRAGSARPPAPWVLAAVIGALPLLGAWTPFERRSAPVEAGNSLMKAGKASEALAEYDKAAGELPGDPGVHFDRGTALAALSRFDEAAEEFLRATEAKDAGVKAAAFYNLGNAFFKKDKFKEAYEAYKRSLVLDPRNSRAKWNSELALVKQREEEKKKQEQKKNDDKKDQKNDQKDKQNQDDKNSKADDKGQKEAEKPQDKGKDDKERDKKDKPEDSQDKNGPDKKPASPDPAADKDKDGQPKPPSTEPQSAEEREMESALDGLDKSPKELEKQRALLRAVRRAPPTRDW